MIDEDKLANETMALNKYFNTRNITDKECNLVMDTHKGVINKIKKQK